MVVLFEVGGRDL